MTRLGIVQATRVRRLCLAIVMLAAVWAAIVVVSGGFAVHLAGIRVSSRAIRNPMMLALMAAGVAVWLARPAYGATLLADARAIVAAAPRFSPATWLLAGGIALRVWSWLLAPPLWLDEEMIALNIRGRSLTELPGPLWLAQSAPLGWLATERLMGVAFGFGEIALRAMPVAFGVAALVVAWWMGRRWLSAAGAAALVFLLSFGQWVFYYSLELKHYSADVCFALLLPALVVWALEGGDARQRLRRAALWWMVAIVAQWWSMGGLLVAPACALALLVALWRRDGVRSAVIVAAVGGFWVAFFALHYAAALRFAIGSQFLQTTWAATMAPASAGFLGRLSWLAQQARPLALKPGGTGLAILFWATALAGFLSARPKLLGVVFAAVPLSAGVLAMVRVVPLFERFALWTTPALYVGIALAIDAGVRWLRARSTRTPLARAAGVLLASAAIVICADAGRRAYKDIPEEHRGNRNHLLDDRSAVRWLAAQKRTGDALITTHLAAPAVWWYADVPLRPPAFGSVLDGMPILEIGYDPPGARCDASALARSLLPYARALVHLGFRFDDVPEDFDARLLDQLREVGVVTAGRQFGESVVLVVELAPAGRRSLPAAGSAGSQGCLSALPASRW